MIQAFVVLYALHSRISLLIFVNKKLTCSVQFISICTVLVRYLHYFCALFAHPLSEPHFVM